MILLQLIFLIFSKSFLQKFIIPDNFRQPSKATKTQMVQRLTQYWLKNKNN